jgi:hypothetical protein
MLETVFHHVAICIVFHCILWPLLKAALRRLERGVISVVIAPWNDRIEFFVQIILALLLVGTLTLLLKFAIPALSPQPAHRKAFQAT